MYEGRTMRRRFIIPVVGLVVVALLIGGWAYWPPVPRPANGTEQGSDDRIREIKNMKEIVASIDDKTLLIFDVDNTLIEPEGNLGSDQWYDYLVRKYMEIDGLGEKAANEKAEDLWNQSQWIIKVRAVEAETP